jgi:hypothetical protein
MIVGVLFGYAVGPDFQAPKAPTTKAYNAEALPAETEAAPGIAGAAQRFALGKDLPLFMQAALAFGPLISLVRDHTLGLIVLDDELIMKSIEACCDGLKR